MSDVTALIEAAASLYAAYEAVWTKRLLQAVQDVVTAYHALKKNEESHSHVDKISVLRLRVAQLEEVEKAALAFREATRGFQREKQDQAAVNWLHIREDNEKKLFDVLPAEAPPYDPLTRTPLDP